MNTQLFAFLFDWQFAPAFCDLTRTDADRGLTHIKLADWQQAHDSGNTNTNLKLTQTAAIPNTGCTLRAVTDMSTMAEQLHPQPPSHDDTIAKKCYLRNFKKLPNQKSIDIPMQTSKNLVVSNSKLSTNAHPVRICLEHGRKACSVLQNYKWNNYVITMSVIIQELP